MLNISGAHSNSNGVKRKLILKVHTEQYVTHNWTKTCITLLSDLKNQTIVSSCVTHILPSCGYFKGQEQICFNPTSWHLVTYNFLRGHKFLSIIRSMTTPTFLA